MSLALGFAASTALRIAGQLYGGGGVRQRKPGEPSGGGASCAVVRRVLVGYCMVRSNNDSLCRGVSGRDGDGHAGDRLVCYR
jgi:hypothetical protein